jgi:hypothetical protein
MTIEYGWELGKDRGFRMLPFSIGEDHDYYLLAVHHSDGWRVHASRSVEGANGADGNIEAIAALTIWFPALPPADVFMSAQMMNPEHDDTHARRPGPTVVDWMNHVIACFGQRAEVWSSARILTGPITPAAVGAEA